MLRSEHVIARLSRGRLVPHRLSTDDPRVFEVVRELCELYAGHVGGPRARLEEHLAVREEELGPRLDARRGFRILRGLSKLLEERAEWTSPTAADPYTIRTRVFELAAALRSEEHTSELQSHRDLHSFPTRRSSGSYAASRSSSRSGRSGHPLPQPTRTRFALASSSSPPPCPSLRPRSPACLEPRRTTTSSRKSPRRPG